MREPQFSESHSGRVASSPDKMRYTAADVATIKDTIQGWVESEKCTLPDLCPALRDDPRDDGKRTRENQALLAELALMFPDRKKNNVIQCAERVMIKHHETATPWTDEQVRDLHRLVEEKGRKWKEIGRDVGHSGAQCSAKYRVEFEARKKSGSFDPEEDDELEQVIRRTKNDMSSSPEDIDVKGMAWKDVAVEMDGVRTAADYARRWQRLRTIFVAKANGSETPKKDADRRRKGHLKGEAMDDENRSLIDTLEKLVHPDSEVQDVVWVGVERALGFPYGAAHRRFNLLVNKFGLKDNDLTFHDLIKEIGAALENGNGFVASEPKKKAPPKRKEPEQPTTTSVPSTTVIGTVDDETDDEVVELPKPKKSKKNKNKAKKIGP